MDGSRSLWERCSWCASRRPPETHRVRMPVSRTSGLGNGRWKDVRSPLPGRGRERALPRHDLPEPWADQICRWRSGDRVRMTRIHELLIGRGCPVSYPSLRRFIVKRKRKTTGRLWPMSMAAGCWTSGAE